jgi:GH24 family phage-related lysozyme (muramidase)
MRSNMSRHSRRTRSRWHAAEVLEDRLLLSAIISSQPASASASASQNPLASTPQPSAAEDAPGYNFQGSYVATYAGTASGTLDFAFDSNGNLVVSDPTVTTAQGSITHGGDESFSGVVIASADGTTYNVSGTGTFEVSASDPNMASGSGTWQSSSGGSGTWTATGTLTLPRLSGQFDDALHKIIYQGQRLSSSLTVSNAGPGATPDTDISIAYYLSRNSDSVVNTSGPGGDLSLGSLSNQAIGLAAGTDNSLTPYLNTVSIPTSTTLRSGSYYLKAVIDADDTLTEAGGPKQVVAVSAALTMPSTVQAINGSFVLKASSPSEPPTLVPVAWYEAAVALAKGTDPIDTHSVQDFIKLNEGLHLREYSDNGNPAIGYGFDLTINGHARADAGHVQQILDAANLKNDRGTRLTVQDLIHNRGAITPSVANDLFTLAFNEAVAADEAIFPAFSAFTPNEQKALLDLTYNVGAAGVKKFTNMVADVNKGSFASAAFELFVSKRTVQVGLSRATEDFLLLASGHESEL